MILSCVLSSLGPDVACTAIVSWLRIDSPLLSSAAATSTSSRATSTSKLQLQQRHSTTPRNDRRRPLVAFHRSISPSTPINNSKHLLPHPYPAPCSDVFRLRQHLPEPPGTLIPALIAYPPSGFRKLHSRTRSCETISYTPRASLKPPRQHASAPPDATASPSSQT